MYRNNSHKYLRCRMSTTPRRVIRSLPLRHMNNPHIGGSFWIKPSYLFYAAGPDSSRYASINASTSTRAPATANNPCLVYLRCSGVAGTTALPFRIPRGFSAIKRMEDPRSPPIIAAPLSRVSSNTISLTTGLSEAAIRSAI